jgi:hypothetical protein
VEAGDLVRRIQLVADVVVPDDLAVGGVKKRNAELAGSDGRLGDAFGVALSLEENVLRTDGELLGLDDADDEAATAEGVVGGPLAVSNSSTAQFSQTVSGTPGANRQTFQPAARSLPSMMRFLVRYSELAGVGADITWKN